MSISPNWIKHKVTSPISLSLEQCRWGPWFNTDTNPGGKGDIELISEIVRIEGSKVCWYLM